MMQELNVFIQNDEIIYEWYVNGIIILKYKLTWKCFRRCDGLRNCNGSNDKQKMKMVFQQIWKQIEWYNN